jgi:alkylation response protein AidB-like acyl-CoA dehydrogenase
MEAMQDGEYLKRALELAPLIREAGSAIESGSALPAALALSLKEQGMFRLLLPRSLGGAELELADYLDVIHVISEADGSTGWCVSQGAVFANMAPALTPEAAQEIWGSDPHAVVATGPALEAEARAVDGGVRLTGRWHFSSGCLHANWLAAMTPVQTQSGARLAAYALLPRSDAHIIESWDVRGMRGTGSHHYSVQDLFVPEPRLLRFGQGGGPATASGIGSHLLFAAGFGAVGLGIARRALDELAALASGKTPWLVNSKLREDPGVQHEIALGEATWGSARAYLLETARAARECVRVQGELDKDLGARLRLAATHAMRESAAAVDRAYNVAGTDGIYTDRPLQRCFQDVHVLTQQVQGRQAHYRTVGQQLLGLEPKSSFI